MNQCKLELLQELLAEFEKVKAKASTFQEVLFFDGVTAVIQAKLDSYKPETSTLTNSEIGSRHWFNTILGNHLNVGEFMTDRPNDAQYFAEWGKQLAISSRELIDNFDKINKHGEL